MSVFGIHSVFMLFQRFEGGFVVGFVGNLGHEFGIDYPAGSVDDYDSAGQQSGQGAVDHFDTIFPGKLG